MSATVDLVKVQAPICSTALLVELQRERAQYEHNIYADTGEAFSNALLDQAEKIKRNISEQHE